MAIENVYMAVCDNCGAESLPYGNAKATRAASGRQGWWFSSGHRQAALCPNCAVHRPRRKNAAQAKQERLEARRAH